MAVRVLVSPYFDAAVVGGGTLNTLDLARAWLARGHEVHVLKCDRPPQDLADLEPHARSGRLVLHGIAPAALLGRANAFDPGVEAAARDVLRATNPESVHVHNFHGMLGAVRAALDGPWPTLYTALGFGLVCPTGYLYDGTLDPCTGPEPAKCQACLWREEVVEPARHRLVRSLPAPVAWKASQGAAPRLAIRLARGAPAAAGRVVLGADARARLGERATYISELPDWLAQGQALLPRFHGVVVATPLMGRVLQRHGVRPERIHEVPWGVLPDRTGLPFPARSPGEPTRLAFLGHAAEVKGLPFLARAVASLPSGLPLEVVAFGSTAWLVERLPPQARRYLRPGAFPPGGAPTALRDVDATLVPSLWHENAPFAVLETLACGRPVIIAERDGMSHLVRDEPPNGLVLPAGDVDAWAKALARVARDPGVLRRMVPNCRWDRTPADAATDVERVVHAALAVMPSRQVAA